MRITVVQCSKCRILSSLADFPRSIIGKTCRCNTNKEILYENVESQDLPLKNPNRQYKSSQ